MLELIPLLCGSLILIICSALAFLLRWPRVKLLAPQFLGVWLTLGAYFFLDWIRFAPWAFLGNQGLNIVSEIIPSLFALLRQLHYYERLFGFLRYLLGISGPWATLIQLNFNPFLRLAIVAPAVVGFISLLTGIWAPSISSRARQQLGKAQIFFCALALLLLIGHLNYLDAWGGNKLLETNLLALFVGARIGSGPYWAMLGLIILMATGLWQIVWEDDSSDP
jgi:hypothetical protein